MKTLFLLNVTAITPRGLQPNHTIKIQDGRITAVLPNEDVHELPADVEIFDACGAYAAPGFIDSRLRRARAGKRQGRRFAGYVRRAG